jgi:Protein of unknown function (DUF1353)
MTWIFARRAGTFLKSVPRTAVLFAAFCLASCASDKTRSWLSDARELHPWGYYSGAPITRWNPDGRTMTLLSELRYIDPKGVAWVAPKGSVVDGASIPRYLWSLMGGPFEGKYRNASVLHDVAYEERNRPWQDCDRMFYDAMRCSGVSVTEAKTMYYVLYKFGHHWKFPVKRARPVEVGGQIVAKAEEIQRAIPVNPGEINRARDWISNTNPSLEQIEARAGAEEAKRPQ